jgi:hypothetical protein
VSEQKTGSVHGQADEGHRARLSPDDPESLWVSVTPNGGLIFRYHLLLHHGPMVSMGGRFATTRRRAEHKAARMLARARRAQARRAEKWTVS